MNIHMVCKTASIRVLKLCIALLDAGHSPTITCGEVSGLHVELFNKIPRYQTARADVTHIHAGVNYVHKWPESPHVIDLHDYPERFKGVLSDSARLVVSSTGYAEIMRDWPSTVVYNKVPASLWPAQRYRTREKLDITALVSATSTKEAIRDYREVHEMLQGNLHVFEATFESDLDTRMFVFHPRPYGTMLKDLTMYRFGWAGAANSRTSSHQVVTHKYWEYIAAGVIPITWRSDEMEYLPWSVDHGDIVLDSKVTSPLRENDPRTLDHDIPALISAYEQAIGDYK